MGILHNKKDAMTKILETYDSKHTILQISYLLNVYHQHENNTCSKISSVIWLIKTWEGLQPDDWAPQLSQTEELGMWGSSSEERRLDFQKFLN